MSGIISLTRQFLCDKVTFVWFGVLLDFSVCNGSYGSYFSQLSRSR